MKKQWLALIMALALAALAACSGGDAASPPPEQTTMGADATDAPENNDTANIVYGEIYETIGNLITLKLIETPDNLEEIMNRMTEGGGFAGGDRIRGEGDLSSLSEEELAALREQFGANGNGEFVIGDGSGGPATIEGGAVPGEGPVMMQPGEDGQPVRINPEDIEIPYTGEESDIIIPVGVPIVTMSRGENGMEETEVKLETLKAGDKLVVYYSAENGLVEKVVLMQGMIMSGGFGMLRTTDGENQP